MIVPGKERPAPAARAPSAPRRSAARRAPRARAASPRELVEGLEQRHLDVIGLVLVAAGVYLAFVLYLGWDGGRVGGWLADGARARVRPGRLRGPAGARRPGALR